MSDSALMRTAAAHAQRNEIHAAAEGVDLHASAIEAAKADVLTNARAYARATKAPAIGRRARMRAEVAAQALLAAADALYALESR